MYRAKRVLTMMEMVKSSVILIIVTVIAIPVRLIRLRTGWESSLVSDVVSTANRIHLSSVPSSGIISNSDYLSGWFDTSTFNKFLLDPVLSSNQITVEPK
jgi:hypothetical protein